MHMGINFPKKLKVPCGLKFRGVNEHQLLKTLWASCGHIFERRRAKETMLKVQWEYQIITLYILKVTQYYMSIIFQYIWEKKTPPPKKKVQWESQLQPKNLREKMRVMRWGVWRWLEKLPLGYHWNMLPHWWHNLRVIEEPHILKILCESFF